MFADALDFVLEFDGEGGDVRTLALGAERIRFAAHFLEDEPEVLALRASLGESVEEQLVVAPEARDFFMDVELVCHDAGFLQKSDVVDFGILHEHVDAFAELVLPDFDAFGVEDFHLVEDVVQVVYATFQILGEVRAFLFAHGDDSVQGFRKFGHQVLFPGLVVGPAVCELQHFRNGKHVLELDFACNAVLRLHGLGDFHELRDGGLVVAHRDVPDVTRAERDGKVHGTAGELILDERLEIVLEVGEVLWNLGGNFEEAAVHAADFDDAADSLQGGFALAEPGHGNNGHILDEKIRLFYAAKYSYNAGWNFYKKRIDSFD